MPAPVARDTRRALSNSNSLLARPLSCLSVAHLCRTHNPSIDSIRSIFTLSNGFIIEATNGRVNVRSTLITRRVKKTNTKCSDTVESMCVYSKTRDFQKGENTTSVDCCAHALFESKHVIAARRSVCFDFHATWRRHWTKVDFEASFLEQSFCSRNV